MVFVLSAISPFASPAWASLPDAEPPPLEAPITIQRPSRVPKEVSGTTFGEIVASGRSVGAWTTKNGVDTWSFSRDYHWPRDFVVKAKFGEATGDFNGTYRVSNGALKVEPTMPKFTEPAGQWRVSILDAEGKVVNPQGEEANLLVVVNYRKDDPSQPETMHWIAKSTEHLLQQGEGWWIQVPANGSLRFESWPKYAKLDQWQSTWLYHGDQYVVAPADK